jgi:DNA-directed RNA polymerase I subunit RPA2
LDNDALVRRGEEIGEMGGFFVCNGNEKLIRIVIAPRANYVCIAQPHPFSNQCHYQ